MANILTYLTRAAHSLKYQILASLLKYICYYWRHYYISSLYCDVYWYI